MIEGESLESKDAGLSVGLPLHGVCIVDHTTTSFRVSP